MPVTIPDALTPVYASPYPFRPRVLFVLKRRVDASPEAFAEALGDWRRRQPFGVGFGGVVARAGAGQAEEQDYLSGQFRAGGVDFTTVDGYVSLDLESYDPTAADFDALFKAADGCLVGLEAVVDPEASLAFAGVANLVIPGAAPLSMILVLDRVPNISLKRYNEWWVHHADDHRRLNPAQVGYHQLHNTPEFNALAAKGAGVATTTHCIVDFMYLGRAKDALSRPQDPSSADAQALFADITAHCLPGVMSGGLFQEV